MKLDFRNYHHPAAYFNLIFIFAFLTCIYLQGARHAGTSITMIFDAEDSEEKSFNFSQTLTAIFLSL
jgi:hypothetical protein